MTMTRGKVLSLAFIIAVLGILQVTHWWNEKGRAASLGKASGMFAVLSSVAVGIYGMTLREPRK